ncbi:hypothetical protein Tco_1021135 [Tanacetum coccineum]
MDSMEYRLNIRKLDDEYCTNAWRWNCKDREAEAFQVSNDDTAVAQRRLRRDKATRPLEVEDKHGLLGKGAGKGGHRFEVPDIGMKTVEYAIIV